MTYNIIKKTFIDFSSTKLISFTFVALAFSFPLSNALNSLFSSLLILLWLYEGNFSKKYIILKNNPLIKYLFLLITLSFSSILWSPDYYFAFSFLIGKYWLFLTIPIVLTSFDIKYTKFVINAFLLSMLISELVSYSIFFEIISYNNISPSDPSPFMNHTDYSVYLSFAIILIINKLYNAKIFKWKIFYFLYLLTSLSNLFINAGRTGQVMLIVTLFILSLMFFRKSYKLLILAIISPILTLYIAYNFSPNFHDRATELVEDIQNGSNNADFDGSMSRRYALWMIGSEIFIDYPLYGLGVMGDKKILDNYTHEYNFDKGMFSGYMDYHNTFVQYAVKLGIGGLLLFILTLYTLFNLKFTNHQYKILSSAFVLIFSGYSFIGFTFGLLHSATLFCVFAGLFNALASKELQ